jgi:hypothetical protein
VLTDDHRRRLALFNEKAAKLLRSPLANTESVSIKLTWDRDQPGVVEHEMEGADEAAIDAFVLTARFFFQDRDGISFRRMAEIYDGPSVPASLADRYRDCRAKLNAYLDLPPGMVANAKALTQGDILDVLL